MDPLTHALLHQALGFGHAVVLADAAITAINESIGNLIHDAQLIAAAVCGGMLCWGGFGYATSQGNPIRMERAKHTLTMAVVGVAIVLLSLSLGDLIKGAIVVPAAGVTH